MTRPIVIAGLLGGLLGGVVSFAASRWVVPAQPKAETAPAVRHEVPPEARAIADAYVAELRAGKFEEFAAHAKIGSTITTDEEAAKFKARLLEFRRVANGSFGPSLGEFEVLGETALSPSLVRLTYLEKFERGGVWWTFVLYHGKDHWWLAWVDWGVNPAVIFAGLS
jgi:hypothetical protein